MRIDLLILCQLIYSMIFSSHTEYVESQVLSLISVWPPMLWKGRNAFPLLLFISKFTVSSTSPPLDKKRGHSPSAVPWNGDDSILLPQPFNSGIQLQVLFHCQDGPQHVLLRTVSKLDGAITMETHSWAKSFQFHLEEEAASLMVCEAFPPHNLETAFAAGKHLNYEKNKNMSLKVIHLYHRKQWNLLIYEHYFTCE